MIENADDAFVAESELMMQQIEAQLERDTWVSKPSEGGKLSPIGFSASNHSNNNNWQ